MLFDVASDQDNMSSISFFFYLFALCMHTRGQRHTYIFDSVIGTTIVATKKTFIERKKLPIRNDNYARLFFNLSFKILFLREKHSSRFEFFF